MSVELESTSVSTFAVDVCVRICFLNASFDRDTLPHVWNVKQNEAMLSIPNHHERKGAIQNVQ